MNYSIGRYFGTFSFSLLKIPSYVNLWSQSIFREHSLSLDHVLWCRSHPTILILFQPKTKIPFYCYTVCMASSFDIHIKGRGRDRIRWNWFLISLCSRSLRVGVYSCRRGRWGKETSRAGTDVIRLFSDRLPLTITTKIFRSPLRPRIRAGFQVLRFSWT